MPAHPTPQPIKPSGGWYVVACAVMVLSMVIGLTAQFTGWWEESEAFRNAHADGDTKEVFRLQHESVMRTFLRFGASMLGFGIGVILFLLTLVKRMAAAQRREEMIQRRFLESGGV